MTTEEFIKKLDSLFAEQEYDKVEPFMLSALEEARSGVIGGCICLSGMR